MKRTLALALALCSLASIIGCSPDDGATFCWPFLVTAEDDILLVPQLSRAEMPNGVGGGGRSVLGIDGQ